MILITNGLLVELLLISKLELSMKYHYYQENGQIKKINIKDWKTKYVFKNNLYFNHGKYFLVLLAFFYQIAVLITEEVLTSKNFVIILAIVVVFIGSNLLRRFVDMCDDLIGKKVLLKSKDAQYVGTHFLGEENADLLSYSNPEEEIFRRQNNALFLAYQDLKSEFDLLRLVKSVAYPALIIGIYRMVFNFISGTYSSIFLLGFEMLLLLILLSVITIPGKKSYEPLKH